MYLVIEINSRMIINTNTAIPVEVGSITNNSILSYMDQMASPCIINFGLRVNSRAQSCTNSELYLPRKNVIIPL